MAHQGPSASIRRAGRILPFLFLAGLARAEGVDGYVEFAVAQSKTHTEEAATGLFLDQTVLSFLQGYRLDFSRNFYPNLQFGIGGFYGVIDTSNELPEGDFDSVRRLFTPYARLTLRMPTFGSQLSYDKRQEQIEIGASTAELVQDTYSWSFSWLPVELPRTFLEFSRKNTHDQAGVGLDITQDRVQLSSQYLAVESLDLYYRGSLQNDRDRLNDGEVSTNSQNFRVSYGDSWLDRRLTFSTDYTFNYRKTEATRPGEGELIEPVVPAVGLSSIDDTPARDPLSPNAAMIDGDRVTPAGINLGLPAPGGDSRPRNIGLDLGFPTELNTILVWVDRELTPAIAASFSWQVYTSDDNLDWVLRQTLPSAPFGPFDNRFKVSFTALASRYVKLVVSPLRLSVPDATAWPDIQVTELEPEIRSASSDLTFSSSRTSQVFDANFRALLVPRANFYYEFAYFLATQSPGATTYTLSNGLSVSHAIGPIMTGAARLTRQESQERFGDLVNYLFTGSLTATPVPAFQASTVVSYNREEGDFGQDRASVTLNGIAQLYRGISANLAVSKTRVVPKAGADGDYTDVNFGLTLVPNAKLTFNLIVQDSRANLELAGAPGTRIDDTRKNTELSVSYRPWRSLYLFGSGTWNSNSLTGSRTLRNFSLSFTPFPDGAFHFGLFYNTSYQTDLDETQETLVPSIRWDITSMMYLNLSYQYLDSKSQRGVNRTEAATATFRATF